VRNREGGKEGGREGGTVALPQVCKRGGKKEEEGRGARREGGLRAVLAGLFSPWSLLKGKREHRRVEEGGADGEKATRTWEEGWRGVAVGTEEEEEEEAGIEEVEGDGGGEEKTDKGSGKEEEVVEEEEEGEVGIEGRVGGAGEEGGREEEETEGGGKSVSTNGWMEAVGVAATRQ
jgi:hypothetical protein